MKTYKVKVTETYVYEIEMLADNKKDALDKVKDGYCNAAGEFDGVFLADAYSFKDVKFKII